MKKKLILVIVLATAACSSGVGEMGMFQKNAPRVLSGDENQILLYDATGVSPAAGLATAKKHCSGFGKTAEWKSNGGTDPDCVSMQLNYCATYICK